MKAILSLTFLLWVSLSAAAQTLEVVPTSVVDYQNRQRIDFRLTNPADTRADTPILDAALEVWQNGQKLYSSSYAKLSGDQWNSVLFPEPSQAMNVVWKAVTRAGTVVSEVSGVWVPPRHWTFYIPRSSRVDVELHDSPYKQRKMLVDYFDRSASDRQLSNAQTFATIASVVNPEYTYPAVEFARAYEALIYNDEHSYGTSDYKGPAVYESWAQHFDWIDKADRIGEKHLTGALEAIASEIKTDSPGVVLFNPTPAPQTSYSPLYHRPVTVPSFGYTFIPVKEINIGYKVSSDRVNEPPTLENRFYRVKLAHDGTIESIFDKELNRELVDSSAAYRFNQILYSPDNYKTFTSPANPYFLLGGDASQQSVGVYYDNCTTILRSRQITACISLPNDEKRIDIENEFVGTYGLLNIDQYMHNAYTAFPFAVEGAKYYAPLNGCVTDSQMDPQTNPQTDSQTNPSGWDGQTYCAAHDWAAAECDGSFGVALIQTDSHLVEFGKIHSDKSSFNEQPKNGHLYSCLFDTRLQKHTPDEDRADYRFRYSILSYPIEKPQTAGWRAAGIQTLARQVNNPLISLKIYQPQLNGTLPTELSFISTDSPQVELTTLKAAQTEHSGFIARFHETSGIPADFRIKMNFGNSAGAKICSVMEQDRTDGNAASQPLNIGKFDYITVQFPNNPLVLRAPEDDPDVFYTGLIDFPRAWFADDPGTLYLLWGNNPDPKIVHYELYRLNDDFQTWKKLADVPSGPYRVISCEDKGLCPESQYIYRLRSVKTDGSFGKDQLFLGETRSVK